jgi:hypothetical protein
MFWDIGMRAAYFKRFCRDFGGKLNEILAPTGLGQVPNRLVGFLICFTSRQPDVVQGRRIKLREDATLFADVIGNRNDLKKAFFDRALGRRVADVAIGGHYCDPFV